MRLERKHVLIIDDEDDQAQALGELLLSEGITSAVVTCAAQALVAIDLRRPDAVVIDLTMPDIDGLRLLQRLRGQLPALPAVLTTGAPIYDLRVVQFLRTNATAYVSKPINVGYLVRALADLIGGSSGSIDDHPAIR